MTRRATYSPRALEDIHRQASFYRSQSPETADRFLFALERTVDSLTTLPGQGHPNPRIPSLLRGLRSWPVPGFRAMLVFYRPTPDGIDVLRVIHGARDVPAVFGREEE